MRGTSLIANVTSRCEAALSTYRSWAQEQISTACTNLTASSLSVIKDPKALHELATNALKIIKSSESGFGLLFRLSGSSFEFKDQLQDVIDVPVVPIHALNLKLRGSTRHGLKEESSPRFDY